MPEKHWIQHPRYGTSGGYWQTVRVSAEEAGHKPLPSEGEFGWEMPPDPATDEFVQRSPGKAVLDIGSGLGAAVVIPALEAGAQVVYAADVVDTQLAAVVTAAKSVGQADRLRPLLLEADWWHQELQARPSVRSVLGVQAGDNVPADGSIDLLIARHSLQFGDHCSVLRFFDLAAAALKPGGAAAGINFTPYTGYLYDYDGGRAMREMHVWNQDFARGVRDVPGGFVHPQKGSILKTGLGELMGKEELKGKPFLYFDEPTLEGLMNAWKASRRRRNLDTSLVIRESVYFSPPSITSWNKLTADPAFANMENHVFELVKTGGLGGAS